MGTATTNTGRHGEKGSLILTEGAFQVHRQMVIALFVATTLVCVALAFGLLRQSQSISMLIVVIAAGALGGFVSALRRLYAFQKVFPVELVVKWKRIDIYLLFYSMIPAIVGAIAAVALYLIFASQLVEGTMFPAFHVDLNLESPGDEFHNFLYSWKPDGPINYAKALVWAFIAGFSERFVPNLLERFVSE